MRYQLEFKNGIRSEALRTLTEDSIEHLNRLAAGVRHDADALSLRVVIERNRVRTLYRVTLKLHIPRRILAVEEKRHEEETAVRAAFAELERKLIRALEKKRPQDSRHPIRPREVARDQVAARPR